MVGSSISSISISCAKPWTFLTFDQSMAKNRMFYAHLLKLNSFFYQIGHQSNCLSKLYEFLSHLELSPMYVIL